MVCRIRFCWSLFAIGVVFVIFGVITRWTLISPAPSLVDTQWQLHDLGVLLGREDAAGANWSQNTWNVLDYCDRHFHVLTRSPGWSEILSDMEETGDAFTLFLLKHFVEGTLSEFFSLRYGEVAPLTDDEVKLIRRAIAQIESRRGVDAAKLEVEEIAPSMIRTSVTDLNCHVLERPMINWLYETLKAHSTEPGFRNEFSQLRRRLRRYVSDDRRKWTYANRVAERMLSYIPATEEGALK